VKGGEMTQTLYVHVNKRKKNYIFIKLVRKDLCFLLAYGTAILCLKTMRKS
jgi:hypothetical protein